jgi:mRNA-degrading endonuclease toxin of MazEF toxin-antitoxin module
MFAIPKSILESLGLEPNTQVGLSVSKGRLVIEPHLRPHYRLADRGDIYHVNLNPIHGREQAGTGYVMVVSPREFNALGTPLVCPIKQDRRRIFGDIEVSLSGAGTNARGVVLCKQPRVLDLEERGARFSEKAPQEVIDEVIASLLTLLE